MGVLINSFIYARLQVQPEAELLAAGCVALQRDMSGHRHIAAREVVHLVWTAAVLKVRTRFACTLSFLQRRGWKNVLRGGCSLFKVLGKSTVAHCFTACGPLCTLLPMFNNAAAAAAAERQQMGDPDFLEGLCGYLARCANQLAPPSLASECVGCHCLTLSPSHYLTVSLSHCLNHLM